MMTETILTQEERDNIHEDARLIAEGVHPDFPPPAEIRRQNELADRMMAEISRRWADLKLDYDDARGRYSGNDLQSIYVRRLETVNILKRWSHKRSCEQWERNNADVMAFMFQLN